MEVGNRRSSISTSSRNNTGVVVVATGSVWENRIKLDEVKGGIKVFSETETSDEKDCEFISGSNNDSTTQVDKKLDVGSKIGNHDNGVVGVVVSGKRRTWKTESTFDGPIQIASKKDVWSKNLDEKVKDLSKNLGENVKDLSKKCKDLSVSADGVGISKKTWKTESFDGNPIQIASKGDDMSKNLDGKVKDLSKILDEKVKDLSDSADGVVGISKKCWKTESFEGNPIQIANKRDDLSKNLDEKVKDFSKNLSEKCKDLSKKCKDLSVSVDGAVGSTKKSWKAESFEGNPMQISSKRGDLSKNLDEKYRDLSKKFEEMCKDLSVSADGVVGRTKKTWKTESFEGSPFQVASKRSDSSKILDEKSKDLSVVPDGVVDITTEKTSNQVASKKSDLSKHLDEKCKDLSISADGVGRKLPTQSKKNSELRKLKSEFVNGNVKKSNLDVRILKKSNLDDESSVNLDGLIGIKKTKPEEFGICEEKFITNNVVSEAKSANKLEKNLENVDDNEDDEEWDDVLEEEIDEDIEKRSVDVKKVRVQEQNKPKKIVIEEKKLQYNNKRQIPVSSINKKQSPPSSVHAKIHRSPIRTKSDEFQSRQHSKMQSLVDLVMWKNVSKSALVFGIGTFVIISSSYTQDLNISFISVLAYLGLIYLAAIFLFRSLIHRRANDIGESSDYVVGEEEAVWVLKLILPCINEFLLKMRALFYGDPSTIMKMAVLLFLLAKFGNYITIWKLSKLGFFGVFVIPKVCSSYSTQLTSLGTFFVRYIRDAWVSCTHKKAVGFAIFTLVWNFSSITARIWAVFMLYVGFRYYQQTLMREDTTIKGDDSLQGKIREQRQVGKKSNLMDTRKQKKAF